MNRPWRKASSDKRTEHDPVEKLTFAFVGVILAAVPALVFFFSFGNVGLLGSSLGVEHRIAYLTGPAVDLAVACCVVAASYLSAHGRSERQLLRLHIAGIFCGMIMVALNTGGAIQAHRWRLACFDAVGPILLIGWGFIAPWLWRELTAARRTPVAAPAADAAPQESFVMPQHGDPAALAPAAPDVAVLPQQPMPQELAAAPDAAVDAAPQKAPAAVLVPQKAAASIAAPAAARKALPQSAGKPVAAANGDTISMPKDERIDVVIALFAQKDTVSGTDVGKATGTSRDTGIRDIREAKALPDFEQRVAHARQHLREAGQPVTEDTESADDPERELVLA